MASRKKTTGKKISKKAAKAAGRKKSAGRAAALSAGRASPESNPLKITGRPLVPISSAAEIQRAFTNLQQGRQRMKETTARERIKRLKKLQDAIRNQEDALFEAVYLDFRKSRTEMELTELVVVKAELADAIQNLDSWMAPQQVDTPVTLLGSSAWICSEPLGTVLILSPWNYPFQLAIAPLIAAVAAGNTALVKPSEFTPHTSRFIKQLLTDVFSHDEVTVLEGDHTTAEALTALPFDHIFFTGSTPVGKIVMRAAAQNLAHVTLELGGKSPAILTANADLKKAARRIMWGKGVNAGQTCIAPDYVFVPRAMQSEFIAECETARNEYYGPNPAESPDYCRIITEKHCARLQKLCDDAVKDGARIAIGGQSDTKDRYMAPTILTDVRPDSQIMQTEIFGPLLPVVDYEDMEEVYDFIASRDKPLALYIFSRKNKEINEILSRTSAGGTTINDVMLHIANCHLPFGGVNQSGIGSYHGIHGFRALSHQRSVLRQGRWNAIALFSPPYTPRVQALTRFVRRYLA
ncbi:MAG: aldehyde dehydrogenase family protein [Leptospiraceae bacterium]|nr:aldehyde dehydrogenase family protein [Leptospiraceae bacterium]